MTELELFLEDEIAYIEKIHMSSGRMKRNWKKNLDTGIANHLLDKFQTDNLSDCVYAILEGTWAIPLCMNCGKHSGYKTRYTKKMFCSVYCMNTSSYIRKKISEKNSKNGKERARKTRETMIKKHGVIHNSQLGHVKEKKKQTCMERYGVENISSLESIKEKKEQTCLKNFGVSSYSKTKEARRKTSKRMIDNRHEYTRKRKETFIKRYGVDHIMKVEEHKNKILSSIKKSLMRRYGVDNPWKRRDIIDRKNLKHRMETFKKYNLDWDLFNNREYLLSVIDVDKDTLCSLSEGIFNGCSPDTIRHILLRNGIKIKKKYGSSRGEREVGEYIISLGFPEKDVVSNSRSVISPKELDIYVPSKNFAIEYNGLYWHNEKSKDHMYHLDKTVGCSSIGIDLFHIFEDEWVEKKDIVKSMISSRLGLTKNKIHARNCDVRRIYSRFEVDEFLDLNHLQGTIHSGKHYGLYHNDELVSMISIGTPRFNKKYSWELLRFCNKIDCSVVGGFSKLLSHVKKDLSITTPILTYADRRYSNGNLYRKFGTELPPSKPGYFWIKEGEWDRIPRYKTMKHKLEKFLGTENFDPSLSERENMELNGFYKIYDCGNLVFEL